jgi:hypothetical protein
MYHDSKYSAVVVSEVGMEDSKDEISDLRKKVNSFSKQQNKPCALEE